MIEKTLAGKRVMFIASASNDTIGQFSMPDDRILFPHFDRLELASNVCFNQYDWCHLKPTIRAAYP
jgi:hypothetical protein